MAKLPEGARTVFTLHDIEGFKHREIGELLDLATAELYLSCWNRKGGN